MNAFELLVMSLARCAPYQPKARARQRPQGRLYDHPATLPGVVQPAPLGFGVVQPRHLHLPGAVQPASGFRPDVAQSALVVGASPNAAWSRLPLAVINALRDNGVSSVEDLTSLSERHFISVTASQTLLQSCRGALAALRTQPFDEALFLQLALKLPRLDSALTVHSALGLPVLSSARSGPPPTATLSALCTAAFAGKPIDVPTEEVWFYVVCECDATTNATPTTTKSGKTLNP